MKRQLILWFCISIAFFASFTSLAQTPQPPTRLEDITVKIDTISNHKGDKGGSGVLVRKSGNSYTILTAHHVVANSNADYVIKIPNKKAEGKFDSYTIESKDYNKRIKQIGKIDLATITINSTQNYRTATINSLIKLKIDDILHVSGYPKKSKSKTGYFHRDGQFLYPCDHDNKPYLSLKNAYCIGIDYNSATTGMSGGPVVDKNGNIVGILIGDATDENQLIPKGVASVVIPIKEYPEWESITKSQPTPAPVVNNPVLITSAYQKNNNYIDVDFEKLMNESFYDDYDQKLVTFTATYYSTTDQLFYAVSNELLDNKTFAPPLPVNFDKNYISIFSTSSKYPGVQGYLSIEKKYFDKLLDFKTGDLIKTEAYVRKINLISYEKVLFKKLVIEVHAIKKIGRDPRFDLNLSDFLKSYDNRQTNQSELLVNDLVLVTDNYKKSNQYRTHLGSFSKGDRQKRERSDLFDHRHSSFAIVKN